MDGTDYEVKILLDTGASTSVFGVKRFLASHPDSLKSGIDSVVGVGGRQAIGQRIPCTVIFKSKPEETFDHLLHPMELGRDEDLVILGRDFMEQFHVTQFDWDQKRVNLGPHLIWEITKDVVEQRKDLSVKIGKQGKDVLEKLHKLLGKFQTLFPESPKGPRACSMGHHVIETTTDQVVRDKIWPIAKKWENEIRSQIEEMAKYGIIQ